MRLSSPYASAVTDKYVVGMGEDFSRVLFLGFALFLSFSLSLSLSASRPFAASSALIVIGCLAKCFGAAILIKKCRGPVCHRGQFFRFDVEKDTKSKVRLVQ